MLLCTDPDHRGRYNAWSGQIPHTTPSLGRVSPNGPRLRAPGELARPVAAAPGERRCCPIAITGLRAVKIVTDLSPSTASVSSSCTSVCLAARAPSQPEAGPRWAPPPLAPRRGSARPCSSCPHRWDTPARTIQSASPWRSPACRSVPATRRCLGATPAPVSAPRRS